MGSAKEAFRSPRAWEDAKRAAAGAPPAPVFEDTAEVIKETDPDCKSIASLKSKYCCGCAACANLCPTNAISME